MQRSSEPCPFCSSSDGACYYEDHVYCYVCKEYSSDHNIHTLEEDRAKYYKDAPEMTQKDLDEKQTNKKIRMIALQQTGSGLIGDLKDRGLTKETCKTMGISFHMDDDKNIDRHIFKYTDEDGKLLARKIRETKKDEEFGKRYCFIEGKENMNQAGLFGWQAFPKGKSRSITVTEGEIDAASVYQMFNSKWPVVSLKNGAGGAERDLQSQEVFNYLDSFENIYVCFDNDEEGRKATKVFAKVFGPKARIVTLGKDFKDANDYLVKREVEAFKQCWYDAKTVTFDSLVTGEGIREMLRNREPKECYEYPWKALNEATFGWRMGEVSVWTAQAKVGKTAIVREVVYHILKNQPEFKIGGIFLEGSVEDNSEGFVSLEANKPLHLPTIREEVDDEEYEKYLSRVPFERLVMYKKDGTIDAEKVLRQIRYFIEAFGCRVLILDNLMSLMSSSSISDDERKSLNRMSNEIVTMAESKDVHVAIVAHLNRENQIYGTAQIEKQANMVFQLERDTRNRDKTIRNRTEIICTFNRFCGITGPCCLLEYNPATGRLTEIPYGEEEEDDVNPVFDNTGIGEDLNNMLKEVTQ